MSIIKSFSVGNGDTFYISHNSDNFTVIDCYLSEDNKERIVNEILSQSKRKGVVRFISTHPDEDHVQGLDYLDDKIDLRNFYCVKNEATKEDGTDGFKRYCALRDSDKAFYITKGCSRKWMNKTDDIRGSSGISILWPNTENPNFKAALETAKSGGSPNNISAIIQYHVVEGVTVLWMGDLETEFMENIESEVQWPKVDILFAPHHGRDSGKVPESILKQLNPKIIIIGEAPSVHLNYYRGYNTITQTSAGDIVFECGREKVNIYVSNSNYRVDFLKHERANAFDNYIGTLNLD